MGCKSRFNSTLILESRNRPITVPIGKQVLIKFKELRFGVREEVDDRVYLVVASIMATLGDVENNVYPLTKADLKSSNERNNTDGDIMIRKIESFLDAKKLPKDKKDLIVRTLQNTLTTDNINRAEDGESQLKRVFIKIVDDLGVYYKIGLIVSVQISATAKIKKGKMSKAITISSASTRRMFLTTD